MTQRPFVSKYTVDFEYDSKKSFYAILGYSKLMDHNGVFE
jgi:hypothetical protein